VSVDVLVIGSGAGGATTALELARRGRSVLVLEEGDAHPPDAYGHTAPEAMGLLYRRRGMTPILGPTPIGYIEGCCVGGSTEINSGFWHRTPDEILADWSTRFDLADAAPHDLAPDFAWAEEELGVGLHPRALPESSAILARGIAALGWAGEQVPRAAPGCENRNACAHGCASGAKQGMSRSLLPRAAALGAQLLPRCRVQKIVRRGPRATGVIAWLRDTAGAEREVRIDAEHLFVCCGPTETPALLRRSGIRANVGESLRLHPMLKVAARFDRPVHAESSVLPLLQVKEFWPDVSFGGSFFTAGHLAMLLGDNGPDFAPSRRDRERVATFYVAVRAAGRGGVRPAPFDARASMPRYEVTHGDLRHLSVGLARLCRLLLAAGARSIVPAVRGLAPIETEQAALRWERELLPRRSLALTAVHAFASCPMGERASICAVDSFGRVPGVENLRVADASMLPDSPGVNPQGSVMAFARRNARHFCEATRP
jgi:choline dehydrogenase-like flavoprotein